MLSIPPRDSGNYAFLDAELWMAMASSGLKLVRDSHSPYHLEEMSLNPERSFSELDLLHISYINHLAMVLCPG